MIRAEQNDCGTAAAVDALRLVCSLSVAAGASEDVLSLVDSGVHDCEFHREDRPNTAGCVSVGTGDWASGRVDVPGSVPLDVTCEAQQQSAASPVAPESSSAPFSFQAMVISLGGKTLMLDVLILWFCPWLMMWLSCLVYLFLASICRLGPGCFVVL